MTKVTMLHSLRDRLSSYGSMSLHHKLGDLIECTWLLIIFLVPVYFNPWCYNAFYFVKALALVFLVSLLLGLVLAQWFLTPHFIKVRDLPARAWKSPLQLAALLLGLMWVVSTLFSVMPGKSLWGNLAQSVGFLPNLAWIIFFLVISQKVKSRPQVLRALYTLLISSGFVAMVGILQFINPAILPGYPVSSRIFSTDGNPLSLSAFLSMTLPVTLALVILNWYGWGSQPRSRVKFAVLLALFGLQLACLAFAQYSITLLLFIIGIFVFFALLGVFFRRKATLVLSILAVLLLALIASVLMGPLMTTNNDGPSTEGPVTAAPVAEQVGLPTLGIRVQIWKSAMEVIIHSPEIPFSNDNLRSLRRIIGYGPETFMATSQLKFPGSLKSSYTAQAMLISQPENHYLYLAVTLGILGLLSFMGLLAVFFIMVFKLLSRANNRETIVLAAAFIAAIVQYYAHIFFNPSYIAPEMVFWLVLGLSTALARIERTGMQNLPIAEYAAIVTVKPGKQRKLMSALIIVIFLTIGVNLTVPLIIANMKVRDGFAQWDKNQDLALTSFTAATLIGPDQASYHNFLGHLAFNMARRDETTTAMKGQLQDLSGLAGNAAIRLEPQLALWRYWLADRETYWIKDASAAKKANILYLYQEADQLFPGNAVILNKWAWALILTGDYETAGQKLAESAKNDPSWLPTVYYRGLLSSREGKLDEAGTMFVTPVKGNFNNLGHFMSLCGQAAPYGEIVPIRDALAAYVKNNSDDWIGFALLGIADTHNGNPVAALDSYKKAARVIPDKQADMLASVVDWSLSRHPGLHGEAEEFVKSLIERAAAVP